jgi:ribosomal RNA-processing protein 17
VNEALKKAAHAGYIDSEEGESDDDATEEWGGFQDMPAPTDRIDHEEEYIDEDRYTTVTVESVNVTKDGLTSSRLDEEESAGGGQKAAEKNAQAQPEKKSNRDQHAKKRKQKFRYETKLERQITNIKQKAKNRRRPKD